jgi:hypothetical protein
MVRAVRRVEAPGARGSSVRQVCLIGGRPEASGWVPGDPVEWAGRAYRVAAVHGEAGLGVRYAVLEPDGADCG